jgi:hypothetical protein
MNAPPEMLTTVSTRTLVFEPTSAGGGSLWDGDNLLATLTALKRTERHGRLSLRGTNDAYDMLCAASQSGVGCRMFQGPRQTATAERKTGAAAAALVYHGRDYLATPDSLASVQDRQPVITLTCAPDWRARHMGLRVAPAADLPLVAFFLFVAYDLRNCYDLKG